MDEDEVIEGSDPRGHYKYLFILRADNYGERYIDSLICYTSQTVDTVMHQREKKKENLGMRIRTKEVKEKEKWLEDPEQIKQADLILNSLKYLGLRARANCATVHLIHTTTSLTEEELTTFVKCASKEQLRASEVRL
jgi:hypothetical protein